MLVEFKVRNFKNFRDEIRFSLESENNYEFNDKLVENGIVKDSVILGYNAAGKTNLGYAIMDIVNHLTDKKKTSGSVITYSNLFNMEKVAHFSYKFNFSGNILEYIYEKIDPETVVREEILINNKKILLNDINKASVNLAGAENLNLEKWGGTISLVKYIYANSVLDESDEDSKVFVEFIKFVNGMLMFSSTEGFRYWGFTNTSGDIFAKICEIENGVEQLQNFLAEMDIHYKLVQKDGGEGPTIFCEMGSNVVKLAPLLSSGTRSLIFFFYWYMQKNNVSFVYVDEFDAFYNTDLSVKVVNKLIDANTLQAVITTHNTDIISNEILRPDCYYVLQDNTIKPFSKKTHKALREAHNLQKMYKAGAFNEEF